MKKTLLTLITLAVLLCSSSATAFATNVAECPATEIETTPVTVIVEKNSIVVKNAEGLQVQIYSITGELVYNQHVDSPSKIIETSTFQKGCYMVKIGKTTRKIIIK